MIKQLTKRDLLRGAGALGLSAFAVRVAAAPAAEAMTPALIEAAKKEGKVTFYTAMDLQFAERLGKAFEAKYPGIAARVERAILGLGDVGRVHLYRWGDGGAHFHVWFIPRPLGMLEASGMMLPLWEDVLPNVSDEELAAAAKRVAEAL